MKSSPPLIARGGPGANQPTNGVRGSSGIDPASSRRRKVHPNST